MASISHIFDLQNNQTNYCYLLSGNAMERDLMVTSLDIDVLHQNLGRPSKAT